MNEPARYNPTITDLLVWARRRAEAYVRAGDAESVFVGEQMARIVAALEEVPASSAWTPVEQWAPRPFEPVLLRLFYQYEQVPPMIEYDVGFWRDDRWQKCRRGRVTHCARINILTQEEGAASS